LKSINKSDRQNKTNQKRRDEMDFEKWEPLYLKILSRFGFTPDKDEKVALWMSM